MAESPELPARYRLLSEIGAGAYATVWRAVDQHRRQIVAIKVLHLDAMSEEDRRRFAQEAQILLTLRHPALVEIYESGVAASGSPYLVMELVQGVNLRERLNRERLPRRQVRHIIEQLCGALVEAHVAGVVHRDVKPENVVLGGRDEQIVKLVDFGTAKRLDAAAPVLTFDDKILGTPQYMAPERASGRPVGGAADVYAVAVMAYEMLTGRLPFDGTTALQVVTQHLRDQPPPMRGVTAEVEQAVLWGMHKDPRARPSAEQLAERLCRALEARLEAG